MDTITTRIDGITHIPEDRLKVIAPAPRSVKIELTNKCNYKCKFCPLAERHSPTSVMDFELFKRITKEMVDIGVEEIGVFFFGESLTAPEYTIECIKYLKSINTPYVFLTTNGSLCKPEIADGLMAAGLDSIKFSINAVDDDQFKEVMGVKPKMYNNAVNNLKTMFKIRNEKGYKTRIYASSIQYDGAQHEKMEKFIDRIRDSVDEHYFLPLYSMGVDAVKRQNELGYKPTAGNQGRIGNLAPPLPCWSVFTEGHVFVDGTFSVCCFDSEGVFEVGDLKTQPFMEVWNSEKFQAIRKAHIDKDLSGTLCEQCLAYK